VLIFFSLPRLGFCEISELLIAPGNLIGNWQVSLGAMAMDPVAFSPQLASVTDMEHSDPDAATAKGTGARHAVPTTMMVATERLFMPSLPFVPGQLRTDFSAALAANLADN